LVPLALAAAACDVNMGNLVGRASETWTRTYPLEPGGEVHIGNTNGRVDVVGVDGTSVEVTAEKIAKAATDEGAKELLPRIKISEEASANRVSIETERMDGIMIGASVEVRYKVKAPKNAKIDVRNTNGIVSLDGMTGKVNAHTTNGGVRGQNLTGSVEATTTNGGVRVDLASIKAERIYLKTTNGGVTLAVPDDAKADISASWTNGGISIRDVKLDVTDRGKRSLEGKMNGGGTPIELHTTNGGIRITSRADATAERTDDGGDDAKDKKSKP
jgi:DUF4097 and DUF4098 domain-containing protein YvlB